MIEKFSWQETTAVGSWQMAGAAESENN